MTAPSRDPLKYHLELVLLAALAREPAHGYGIAAAVRSRSRGKFALAQGTLYPALHRLQRAGLLASRWSDASGRRRRLYYLTARGKRALRDRKTAWRGFVRAVGSVVAGS